MNEITNEQDFNSGYATAMTTISIILHNLLDELEDKKLNESVSSAFELAKERIKITKDFCLEEALNEEGLTERMKKKSNGI